MDKAKEILALDNLNKAFRAIVSELEKVDGLKVYDKVWISVFDKALAELKATQEIE